MLTMRYKISISFEIKTFYSFSKLFQEIFIKAFTFWEILLLFVKHLCFSDIFVLFLKHVCGMTVPQCEECFHWSVCLDKN